MRYKKIDAELFKYNRERFMKQMEGNSVAIFHANDIMPTNADGTFHFRQNNDLFYLTGVDQEDTALMLFPDAPVEQYKEVLFIRRTNDYIKVWEGEKLTREQATEVSGIQNVVWFDELDTILSANLNYADSIYICLNEHDRNSNRVITRNQRYATELRERYPLHTYLRSAPIMEELRAIKHDIEIDLMQTACNITEKAFRRVLSFTRPGVNEYEIEAEIIHEFMRNGANGHAYHPIIASGADSCILHYDKNNKVCQEGDVLLMDFGAEYANYSADLSRTIPIIGRFTDRQKQVYNSVLKVMKEAIQMLRPGTLLNEYHKEVGKLMTSELIDLGVLTKADVDNQNPKMPAYKKYFMHGTSHFIGLDTHDVGNRYEPMKAGMVFTCEPGIYLPDEKIGIRLENDILVDHDGPIDLMKNIPLEVEEIEDLMNG